MWYACGKHWQYSACVTCMLWSSNTENVPLLALAIVTQGRPWLGPAHSELEGSNVYSQCWLLSLACDQCRTVSLSLIRKPQARPNHGGTVAALTA